MAPEPRVADGIREVRRLFQSAQNPPRWPMYVRQAKQFLRNVDPTFDERRYGFASLVDLVRACQREGLFRIERDRQGVMRLFQGNIMQPTAAPVDIDDALEDVTMDEAAGEPVAEAPQAHGWNPGTAPGAQVDVVEADIVQEIDATPPIVDGEEAQPGNAEPASQGRRRSRQARKRQGGEGRASRKSEGGTAPAPRARKPAKPRSPGRARPRKETPPAE